MYSESDNRPSASGHRSQPSESYNVSFGDIPVNRHGAGDNRTESESVFSGAEDEPGNWASGSFYPLSPPATTRAVSHGRISQSQSQRPVLRQSNAPPSLGRQLSVQPNKPPPLTRIPASGLSSANTTTTSQTGMPSALGIPGRGMQRAPSGTLLRPDTGTNKGKGRSRSRSKVHARENSGSDTSGDESREGTGARARSFDDGANVLPTSAKPVPLSNNVGIEDDEVERRDRGEELVRKRMRERKREKKAAEKRERKRKDEEIKRDREKQLARTQTVTGVGGALSSVRDSMVLPSIPPGDSAAGEGHRPSLNRGATEPARYRSGQSMSREASSSSTVAGPSSPQSLNTYNGPFWPPLATASSFRSTTPTPTSPFFPPAYPTGSSQRDEPRGMSSYAPSNISTEHVHGHDADVTSDDGGDEDTDIVPELAHRPGATWRDDSCTRSESTVDDRHPEHQLPFVSQEEEHPQALLDNDDGGAAEEEDEDEEDYEDEGDSPNDEGVEYTLKDRQDAINIEHPFGLPIWKPALYKKDRSANRNAEHGLHESPSYNVEHHLLPGNIAWTTLFGWWMAIFCMLLSILLRLVPFGGGKYGSLVWDLGTYLFWPFGRYVERYDLSGAGEGVRGYDEETDDGNDTVFEADYHSRDIEQAGNTWRKFNSQARFEAGKGAQDLHLDSERTPIRDSTRTDYGTGDQQHSPVRNSRSGSETEVAAESPGFDSKDYAAPSDDKPFRVRALGRLAYWTIFYLALGPLLLVVCTLCWACVFTIPMAKLLWILLTHLNKEPLALSFRYPSPNYAGNNSLDADASGTAPVLEAGQKAPRHSRETYSQTRAKGRIYGPEGRIVLCTYKAFGIKYYKYTIDGTNIIFINLLPIVAFVIADFFIIAPVVHRHNLDGFLAFIAGQETMFLLALLSVIPLSPTSSVWLSHRFRHSPRSGWAQ